MASLQHITLDPRSRVPLLKARSKGHSQLPIDEIKTHPAGSSGAEDGTVFFVGTATTVIMWQGIRIMTDPNFLHAGDHVHLGPGVSATRRTNPAVDLEEMPPMDCVLLSHYHEDHFDRLVEDSLNRDFPVITTPHARRCLTQSKPADEAFKAVTSLDAFEGALLRIAGQGERQAVVKVTGMPGKHVPPGPLAVANDLLGAVPPTNGWLLELGYEVEGGGGGGGEGVDVGYRIYISGDTLMVDELKQIPKYLDDAKVDLMLVHLGGTTIPGPSMPLLMVTMDARQGVQLMQLIGPDVTIPIHFDDYDVFMSPLEDFKKEVEKAGFEKGVVYLDRGEAYGFTVKA
ncbi:hypothetical protein S7711_06932 [Stachybotrys chartarum IBT 7711]|uniref:Metallo-beta-lactamase domain-containing protein n=1 Tax=Stachybotrys chartarum (strain CBS 109288 / IBT 7711) TaxID=1280523 RepID=A0A084AL45_STACB|nr:hypothetical protein S7711_06932 [Stachybotrys chartarum IBT 7711]KFA51386.1 hypothetical protein S40293_03209 [Stachybotrys chartarum IBT 40293]